jgi:hypothetical protein
MTFAKGPVHPADLSGRQRRRVQRNFHLSITKRRRRNNRSSGLRPRREVRTNLLFHASQALGTR